VLDSVDLLFQERELHMKKMFLLLLLVCFAVPCLADDTIYCPTDAKEREKKCQQAKEENKAIDETINRWEPMVNNSTMMMYMITRMKGESPNQYASRVSSMKAFYYRGLNYPVRGRFTRNGTAFIPLTYQEAEGVLSRAFQSRQEVAQQMEHVRKNTQTLKPMIKNKMAQLQKDRQRNWLFLAQCCGYRWTTEEPPKTPERTPDTGGQRGLLGVESEEQTQQGIKY
jgi:hypothetical protein